MSLFKFYYFHQCAFFEYQDINVSNKEQQILFYNQQKNPLLLHYY